MKTDEQAAKEYCKNKWEYAIEENEESFLAGCQHKQAGADEKAMLFAEWTHSIPGLSFDIFKRKWRSKTLTTITEYETDYLLSSESFLAYYEERRNR
jgi:hypothetical protein